MKVDSVGIAFIKTEEAGGKPRLVAYQNKADRWTIGYGNTFYEDGSSVKQGDTITSQRAETLFSNILNQFSLQVSSNLKVSVSQNQFNALVSYAYSRGIGSFTNSQLLKLVNKDSTDVSIKTQFVQEWGTNEIYRLALIERRKREAILYFTNIQTSSILTTIEVLTIASILYLLYRWKKKTNKNTTTKNLLSVE